MTTISSADGKAFAEKFVTQFAAGFKENNHAVTLQGLLADKVSWDWSDDTKGSGTPADILGIFAKSPAASSSPCAHPQLARAAIHSSVHWTPTQLLRTAPLGPREEGPGRLPSRARRCS